MIIFIGVIGVYILFRVLSSASRHASKQEKNARILNGFRNLGNMRGKTKAEIIRQVGEPSHISYLADNKSLLQWISPNFHVALQFDGDLFETITHEASSNF